MSDQSLPHFADKNGKTLCLWVEYPDEGRPATLADLIDQVTALSAEQRQHLALTLNPSAVFRNVVIERDAAAARIADLEREAEGMKNDNEKAVAEMEKALRRELHAEREQSRAEARVDQLRAELEEAKRRNEVLRTSHAEEIQFTNRLQAENEKLRAERDPARIAERQREACTEQARLHWWGKSGVTKDFTDAVADTPLVTDPKPREEAKCKCNDYAFRESALEGNDCPVHGVNRPGQAVPAQHPAVAMANEQESDDELPDLDEAEREWARLESMSDAEVVAESAARTRAKMLKWCQDARVAKARLSEDKTPYGVSPPAPSDARPEVDDGCKHGHLLAYGCSACDNERARSRVVEPEAVVSALFRQNVALNAVINDIAMVVGDNPRVREIIAMAREGSK